MNIEKTEGMWLGNKLNRNYSFGEINWKNTYVKALGVYFGYNKQEIERLNWSIKLDSIRSCLKCWNGRDLSLQGLVLIIKTFALSKVIYFMSAISTPKWVINQLNKELFGFLWRYKRDKIARKVIVNETEKGGLNMIDVKKLLYCYESCMG